MSAASSTGYGKLRYKQRGAVGKRRKLLKPNRAYSKASPAFAKKVQAVLHKDEPCGEFRKIWTIDWNPNTTVSTIYHQFLLTARSHTFNVFHDYFGFDQVNDAAAAMFKAKTMTADSELSTYNAANFDKDSKIHVEKQSVVITVRNNFEMAGTLKVVTCFPKRDMTVSPLADWIDAKSAYTLLYNGTSAVTVPQTYSEMGDMPTNYHNFNVNWSTNTKSYRMTPGKIIKIVRNGPSGVYDNATAKMDQDDVPYKYFAKGKSQTLFFVWIPDLNQNSSIEGEIGRVTNTASTVASLNGDLVFETVYRACIRAPEETSEALKHQVRCYQNYAKVPTAMSSYATAQKPVASTNTL